MRGIRLAQQYLRCARESRVVRADAAGIWVTGKSWFQVPPVAKVTFTGTLPSGVTGKDVIVALCGLFKSDVLNHAVEFAGSEETMASISIDNRLTISNMSTEWSALAAMVRLPRKEKSPSRIEAWAYPTYKQFPMDQTLKRWLRYKATEAAMFPDRTTKERITHEKIDELYANPVQSDPGAHYAKQLYLNLSTLSPYISGPNSVKISTPLSDLAPEKIKVDKAYIVSCTNSRASDLAAAAKVFQDAAKANGGKIPKIAEGVKLYVAAASTREQGIAEDEGSWQTLLEAGSIPLPASCGPCIGLGTGLLEDGEVGISASNRNFKGRMGSRNALAYLASPEVVAASALNGLISGTGVYEVPENYAGVEFGYGTGAPATTESELGNVLEQLESLIDRAESSVGNSDAETTTTPILPGFPEKISGEIVFCDADNLDTDNIYPGKSATSSGEGSLLTSKVQESTHTRTTLRQRVWPTSACRTMIRISKSSPNPTISSSLDSTLAVDPRESKPRLRSWPSRSRSLWQVALEASSPATASTTRCWA